ncbi:MAG: hypothetical protein HYS55_06270 [Candidatus Omnitrophica bacterium]|nr:hypothetical protein [Candidatus Omnitrophota bacterium]
MGTDYNLSPFSRLLRPVHPLTVLAMTCFFCFTFLPLIFAEEIPIRIDGRVIRVDEAKHLLVVDFEHPATGEKIKKEFIVSESAGFKDFKKLGDLKPGDLVSLDYLDYKPLPKAIYIIHIPLSKVYFTHQEVAQALVKVKSKT